MQTCKHKTGFRARKVVGSFEKRAPGARFLKVPIINGRGVSFYSKDRGFTSFASKMIKPSVNETKLSSLLARTRVLILYISIWKFDIGPEKLPGLSRNGPLTLHLWSYKYVRIVAWNVWKGTQTTKRHFCSIIFLNIPLLTFSTATQLMGPFFPLFVQK